MSADSLAEKLDDIRFESVGSGGRIVIPPAGYATGCFGMAFGILFTGIGVVLTLSNGPAAFRGTVFDFVILACWGVAVYLLVNGAANIRRRVVIEFDATQLAVSISSILGNKIWRWKDEDVVSVSAENSNTSIDHKPIPQIRVHAAVGKDLTVMLHRPREQVDVVVSNIHSQFHPKGVDAPPDKTKQFLLTRIQQWQPGHVVEISSPKLTSKWLGYTTLVGATAGGVLAAIVGGILREILGKAHVSMTLLIALSAATCAVFAVACVQAAMGKFRIQIDWSKREVTTDSLRDSQTHTFDEIQAVVVRPIVTYNADAVDSNREITKAIRYRSELILRFADSESRLLISDKWTDTAEQSTEPLVPLALELAESVPTEIAEEDNMDWESIRLFDWRCANSSLLTIATIGALLVATEIGRSLYSAMM